LFHQRLISITIRLIFLDQLKFNYDLVAKWHIMQRYKNNLNCIINYIESKTCEEYLRVKSA